MPNEAALATIKDRLTEPTWLRLLRWLTFDSDRSVAASAAICANDIEPQPSALIRKPLLDALHDGARALAEHQRTRSLRCVTLKL